MPIGIREINMQTSWDVYNKETADCVSEYTSIAENYGNKIVSLSECGTVGLISEQWASGARWSWFMPWYDGTNEDGSPVVHADEAWWKDAMSQEFVVSREELPSMEQQFLIIKQKGLSLVSIGATLSVFYSFQLLVIEFMLYTFQEKQ